MNTNIRLSAYGRASLQPAPVNAMMAAFAAEYQEGRDINLGVGYVNEDTMPREQIRAALDAVLRDPARYRFPLNYGGPRGSDNLARSLRRFHAHVLQDGVTEAQLDTRQVLVGANGATSLLEGIAQVLQPGIVLTSDPLYYIYADYLERVGHRVLAVPEDDQGISAEGIRDLLRRLGSRRRSVSFIYVAGVGNPTGTILSNRRRREMVRIAGALSGELRRAVPLVIDRAYDLLVHDPDAEQPVSMAAEDEQGIVYEIGTLSKILAPALRIGYLIGPAGPLCETLVQRTSDIGFSAPLINQEMASFLLDHHVHAQRQRVNAGYRRKALRIRAAIDAELGSAVRACRGGSAGFYFYLTLDRVETAPDTRFHRFLARATGDPRLDSPDGRRAPRVLYIPGVYCVHPGGSLTREGPRQLRISYGFEATERIVQALGMVREAADYAGQQAGGDL